MELLSRRISPFSARVRIAIRAKELPVRISDDPDVRSDDFARSNPMRRVPVLVLDDGRSLPESDAIVEYLEEISPRLPLLPADPFARARVRCIARAAELHVFPLVVPMFGLLAAPPSDAQPLDDALTGLDAALRSLAALLDDGERGWQAYGASLTSADTALAPFLFYVQVIGKRCDRDPLAGHPRLRQFWQGACEHGAIAPVLQEMGEAMAAASRAR